MSAEVGSLATAPRMQISILVGATMIQLKTKYDAPYSMIDDLLAQRRIWRDMSERRLQEANDILKDYTEPNSMIDMGNLFFAATEFKAAYEAVCREKDNTEREVERLKRVIAQELSENDELGAEYTYVRALKEDVARLLRRHKKRLKKNSALAWQADHQKLKLGELGLADEFAMYGCDSIERVGEALLHARSRIARLQKQLAVAVEALKGCGRRGCGTGIFEGGRCQCYDEALSKIETVQKEWK